ncbi:hypothetical protein CHS0354_013413 [Potamilus streckersoni]|uniref:Uncharacterized protein n=1 Tax=Potamilus streckersoni TaxID=2493646 RepID=A0AAE0RVZ3_9BIVA|nr:hypothetical protein CHS0354_013413 [Potamilus streckersoni]
MYHIPNTKFNSMHLCITATYQHWITCTTYPTPNSTVHIYYCMIATYLLIIFTTYPAPNSIVHIYHCTIHTSTLGHMYHIPNTKCNSLSLHTSTLDHMYHIPNTKCNSLSLHTSTLDHNLSNAHL